jgi:surface antigen
MTAALLVLSVPAFAGSCVAYARHATGFELTGDAWQWWDLARGVYPRGYMPARGAVIVFDQTGAMPFGHLAVVRSIRGPREILIDQANWQTRRRKGAVEKAVSVVDVSPTNDWSEVRVEWTQTATYGRVNPIRGFIYAIYPHSQRVLASAAERRYE